MPKTAWAKIICVQMKLHAAKSVDSLFIRCVIIFLLLRFSWLLLRLPGSLLRRCVLGIVTQKIFIKMPRMFYLL